MVFNNHDYSPHAEHSFTMPHPVSRTYLYKWAFVCCFFMPGILHRNRELEEILPSHQVQSFCHRQLWDIYPLLNWSGSICKIITIFSHYTAGWAAVVVSQLLWLLNLRFIAGEFIVPFSFSLLVSSFSLNSFSSWCLSLACLYSTAVTHCSISSASQSSSCLQWCQAEFIFPLHKIINFNNVLGYRNEYVTFLKQKS